MILHINHVQPGRADSTSGVVSTLLTLLEEGHVDPVTLGHLNVHVDWVQYKTNFRHPVAIRRVMRGDEVLPLAEIAVDLRQVRSDSLRPALADALSGAVPNCPPSTHLYALEPFGPMRRSIVWSFNKLFWQHLTLWERASGRGYEKALPTGVSDGHNPTAIADSVADFWTLLKDLESQKQLPPELFILEIGVGTGERASRWLDNFKELDRERGTQYYPKLRFLAADYSMVTLNRAMERVSAHRDLASFITVDALDPFKSLSFLRYKILLIHLSNVYDNLPTDELVLRDGKMYFVEVRAVLESAEVQRICNAFDVDPADFQRTVSRLLDAGPEQFRSVEQGVGFWQSVWAAVRLEERLVAIEMLSETHLPAGMRPAHIEGLIADAPANLRFHLSSGAAESFINTIPLLHPRGYLQVQDIFVTKLADYLHSFRGPGKMDGSIVNWVNGALLAEVGEQAGYDVHFAPFRYREGSRTSILYTTHRE